jgi:hypothetical protein
MTGLERLRLIARFCSITPNKKISTIFMYEITNVIFFNEKTGEQEIRSVDITTDSIDKAREEIRSTTIDKNRFEIYFTYKFNSDEPHGGGE